MVSQGVSHHLFDFFFNKSGELGVIRTVGLLQVVLVRSLLSIFLHESVERGKGLVYVVLQKLLLVGFTINDVV
jgi:hypothetical protein